jgi:hypothetical protein
LRDYRTTQPYPNVLTHRLRMHLPPHGQTPDPAQRDQADVTDRADPSSCPQGFDTTTEPTSIPRMPTLHTRFLRWSAVSAGGGVIVRVG